MKIVTAALTAIALVAPAVLSAADFEGVVQMNMTGSHDRTMPLTFSMKSGLTRIDMEPAPGMTAAAIMDPVKQEVTMVMPQQRMYMVQPLSGGPAAPMDAAKEKYGDAQLEKTNEHEKILGYDTTKYVAKTKDGTTAAWMTDQLGTFMGLGGGGPMGGHRGAAPGRGWEELFKGKQAFPLRVVTTSANGRETFKLEATAIDKKTLPASLFQPPADFRKLDLGAMMQGMGMPGGMPPGRGDQ